MAREINDSTHLANVAGIRFSLGLVAVIVVVFFLRNAQAIVLPFFVALFGAAVVSPLIFWLQRRGVPTAIAVLAVVSVIAVLGLLIGLLLISSVDQFTERVPYYRSQLDNKLEAFLPKTIGGEPIDWTDLLRQINPGQAMSIVASMLNGVRGVLTQTMLIALLMVFMLLDLSGFLERLNLVSPSGRAYLHTVAISLKQYIAIKTVISLCTGVAAGLCCYFVGVDFAILWGFLAFLLNYIPSIGSILAAIPAVALAFVQLGPGAAFAVAAGYLVINVLMGNLIEPRVMGRGLGLSALVVFVSLIFWGWVLGPMGMLLSVPLTMVIKIALDANPRTRWISLLMGSTMVTEEDPDRSPTPDDGQAAATSGVG